MFSWRSERTCSAFCTMPGVAAITAPLAANQGLYNRFLAAGLRWGVIRPNKDFAWQIRSLFVLCVAVTGAHGAATVKRSILSVQTVPSHIGLALVRARTAAGRARPPARRGGPRSRRCRRRAARSGQRAPRPAAAAARPRAARSPPA
nr:DUF1304 domain-containing protein [Sorangium cellulosum]